MKFLVVFLMLGVVYADISTIVTTGKPAILEIPGVKVTIPCSYEMLPSEDQPPIIYWIKGTSVDDPNAVVIFKGYRYWNESLGEYRQFYGDYEKRGAAVPDLKVPSLVLPGISNEDEGRYWCMVAEWSGRQQQGTDADSVALMVGKAESYLDARTDVNQTVNEGDNARLDCGVYYDTADVITWYEGPFHNSDTENFTHTEVGTYKKVGSIDLASKDTQMESDFGKMFVNEDFSLTINGAVIADSGRYWCEGSKLNPSNVELETDRASIELIVTGYLFECNNQAPGLYSDPEDCSMYYECVSGDARTYHRSCGYDGLVFDDRYDYCDWAANVPPPCGTKKD
ncbi:uncharacterized protein LOC143462809 [Clavelina lepadiformis]|uniref:uncharacterized protein LOC143462809 n=1 Tax=Clavelina lepadiformis TaxID=159417 RepID=UPI0040420955